MKVRYLDHPYSNSDQFSCKIYKDILGSHAIPSGRGYKIPPDRITRFTQTWVQYSHRQKIWGSLVLMTRYTIEDILCDKLLLKTDCVTSYYWTYIHAPVEGEVLPYYLANRSARA